MEFSEPREIIDAFASALNVKDPDRIGAVFSEDAVFVSVTGAVMRGRNGIIEGHAAAFAGPLADSTFRFDSITELPVTADVTVLHVHGIREGISRAYDYWAGDYDHLPARGSSGKRRLAGRCSQ